MPERSAISCIENTGPAAECANPVHCRAGDNWLATQAPT
ncbi:MAG: hypothetical protein JWP29_2805 [Rhodoferax sp.]|nr:hypothetical protein [Rhodoferax sp.]